MVQYRSTEKLISKIAYGRKALVELGTPHFNMCISFWCHSFLNPTKMWGALRIVVSPYLFPASCSQHLLALAKALVWPPRALEQTTCATENAFSC